MLDFMSMIDVMVDVMVTATGTGTGNNNVSYYYFIRKLSKWLKHKYKPSTNGFFFTITNVSVYDLTINGPI